MHSTSLERLKRWHSGAAAVEFGLFAPILLIMLVGTIELGISMYQAMQVSNAVEAGALWVMKTGDVAGIAAAAQNASAVTGITATTTQFCGCPNATGITATVCGSGATCGAGTPAGQYVRINAQLPHQSMLVNTLGLPATFTAKSIVRLD